MAYHVGLSRVAVAVDAVAKAKKEDHEKTMRLCDIFAAGVIVEPKSKPHDIRRDLPSVKLWAAVLERAILDLLCVGRNSPRPRQMLAAQNRSAAAMRWILSENNDFSSFNWVCWILGLDPQAMRDRLVYLHREGVVVCPEKEME